jgi:hypothetical protein
MFTMRSLGALSIVGMAYFAVFTAVYAADLPQSTPQSSIILAQDKPANTPTSEHKMMDHSAMTPELKKDMADMYQNMANCLRSDKSFDQCRHEAKENCPVMKKTGHCPINEGSEGVTHKGMKHPMPGMGKGEMNMMKDNAHPSGEK